jgi:hypothetical protein
VFVKPVVKPVSMEGIPAVVALQVCGVVIACFSRAVVAACV